MSQSQILLKGGVLLVHDDDNHVVARQSDLLIQGDRIQQIHVEIQPPEGARVIDCHGTIISPGFIDTHRHLWQSQQKGLHADQIMLDYYHSGNLASSHYEPNDVFWGVLSSAMESIDAGTTTVVDHAHVNYSPEHNKEAIRATITSGIRSIFCYCPHPRVTAWQPEMEVDNRLFPQWVMETYREFAAMRPFGPGGRVKLGFAIDSFFVPPQMLKDTFAEVRKLGAQLITSHATRVSMLDLPSVVTVMHENGLLGSDVLLSHANQTSEEELQHIKESGAHLSSTPLSEMQMGHGHPVCLQSAFQPVSSLGTDSNTICTSYLPAQMETVLQSTRARRTEEQMRDGSWDATIGPTVQDAYNLGTILGAQAIGLDSEIGSLRTGKKADIVIFHGQSPSMISAAARNPVAAIVLHSSVRDVQTVIVDGIIRKDQSQLNAVSVMNDITQVAEVATNNAASLKWDDVARELDRSRNKISKITENIEEESARGGLIKSFLESLAAMRAGSRAE